MSLGDTTALLFLAWIAWGILWLYPKKRALLRRTGDLSDDDVARLASSGDVEVIRLRRLSRWYLAVGLVVLVPLGAVVTILK
jgi:hypothetical protein